MVVYIALSKLHIAAASPSGMQRFGREREREYMHNPAPGCLQCADVRLCVCVRVGMRARDRACVCSYINPQ